MQRSFGAYFRDRQHPFDLGANLKDTVFRVFGGKAKLTAVCDIPRDLDIEELQG